jgi:pyruvate,water dikinase
VSGAATPDEWVVRGDSAVRGSGEEAIDAAVVRAVAALARQVEQHQGRPQDVEWALAGETVVLLQARPITALRERPIDPVPVPVEPPHGYWLREASHAPVPWMPMGQAWLRLRTPALRGMCKQFGFLIETGDVRDIGGWEYFRVVPIGGRDRPAPPPALVPLLFRLVPSLGGGSRNA